MTKNKMEQYFNCNTHLNKDDLLDELLLSSKFDDFDVDFDSLYQIASESIEKTIDSYKNKEGNIYVDDWSEFDQKLEDEVVSRLLS